MKSEGLITSAVLVLGLAVASAPVYATERSTSDRPDGATGSQIHFMYVVPSDGKDRGLDTDGTLEKSIASLDRWLCKESKGFKLRIDRFQDEVDITFHRLSRTDAQMAGFGLMIRDEIEKDLVSAGFNAPDKIYAVYYDGRSEGACGGSFWPPALPGKVVAQYLKGEVPGAMPCGANRFASFVSDPGYWEHGMLHDLFHGLGAVATCAPHHTRAGHSSDDPRDLMYAGDEPWRPSIIDINKDDYFGHVQAGCLDLEESSFLTRDASGSCKPAKGGKKQ